MYAILDKEQLSDAVFRMDIEAPLIARKSRPGQFIMLRIDEAGERIPLTIAGADPERGVVTIIFQAVGKTTMALAELKEGQAIQDFVGPLGIPSHLEGYKRVAVIGGGLGCAIAYPQAKELKRLGAWVDVIAGFRNKDLVFLEKEMTEASDRYFVMTDDGSYGEKGLVTDKLRTLLEGDGGYDLVIAIGPLVMMKFVSLLTKEFGVPTIVSMNTIMVDGTGMCGGCRLTVDGKVKFACVDGPDFDGHLVDFDEAMRRSVTYRQQEQAALEAHRCRLEEMADAAQHAAD